MKRSNRLILLIGIFLAVIAFVGVVLLLGQNGGGTNASQPPTTTTVVVAAQDVQLGTILTQAMVQTTEVKIAEKPVDSYVLVNEVVGKTVTTSLTKGQIVNSLSFATTTTNPDVARLLDPGKGAIAVTVDQVSGVGTLIKPGDRVDVVMALSEDQVVKNPVVAEKAPTKEGQPPVTVRNFETVDPLLNNTTVKVLVENLRVVGTLLPPATTAQDQAQPQASGAPASAPNLNGQSEIVLLEVTPQQAELVRFTQLDGNLSLVLRAPGDGEAPAVATTGITVRQLVDKYGVLPPRIVVTELP